MKLTEASHEGIDLHEDGVQTVRFVVCRGWDSADFEKGVLGSIADGKSYCSYRSTCGTG